MSQLDTIEIDLDLLIDITLWPFIPSQNLGDCPSSLPYNGADITIQCELQPLDVHPIRMLVKHNTNTAQTLEFVTYF
jgi:hypothetical protein